MPNTELTRAKKEVLDVMTKLRTGEYKELPLETKIFCPEDKTFKSVEECMDMKLISSGKIESFGQFLYAGKHNGQIFPFSKKTRCQFFKGVMTGGMTQILRDIVCSFPSEGK